MIAIEGDHLLEEALRSGMVLKTVFVSERREVPKIVPRGVEVMRLAEEVFGSVVETQSPQGVAALMVPPVWVVDDVMGSGETAALILVAVGLQDPGNLGTLVRSAEAFGATGVLTTPEAGIAVVSHLHRAPLQPPMAAPAAMRIRSPRRRNRR